jgi:15-cis-phytoene synthase
VSQNRVPAHFTNASVTNFYYSFLFLPREKRRAIEAVYAFARRGDDISDGGLLPARAAEELALYRSDLASCYTDGTTQRNDPALNALAETIQRFKIPRKCFEDLTLGLEMDLKGTHYRTAEDLLLYCYRVAGTIGLISMEIFGYQNPRARDYAVNLGTALQLVNILRDLKADGENGRIYLPDEDLDRFGIKPGDILSRKYTDSFIELMQFESDRARSYFQRARQALAAEDKPSMLAAEIMGAIYWQVFKRIQKRCYNVFGERIRLPRPQKLWVALKVYMGIEWLR